VGRAHGVALKSLINKSCEPLNFHIYCKKGNYHQQEVSTLAYKITDACIACGVCKDECPVSCISEGDIYVIDEATCIDCDACAGVCPVDACVSA